MRGNDSGVISPETGLRVKRYQAQLVAEVSALTVHIGSVSLKGIVPNAPVPSIRKGRVIKCGLIGATAAAGAGEFTPTFYKRIAAAPVGTAGTPLVPAQTGQLPAGCTAKLVAFQPADVATFATLPAYTPHELTEAQLAPDERDFSDHRGATGAATGAGTTTQLAASASGYVTDYYVGSLLRRLDTGEGQIITAYNSGTKVATHATWTRGTVDTPAGTPYILKHDNRIVRPNDNIVCVITAVGGGTQPTLTWFYVDVLELATYNANNFA